MADFLALCVITGIFCGGLFLAGLVAEQLADEEEENEILNTSIYKKEN